MNAVMTCVNILDTDFSIKQHNFTFSFIITSKYKSRLTVLNFFENLRLNCSYFVLNLIGCKQCEC